MTHPTLGTTTTGAAAPLDLDRLIETRLLVQGTSGSGKSYAVRRLLEETHGRVQHLVLDAEGEYATLRERFDYVLAGPGGDCPAEPRHAGLLARRLLELSASAIVDLHEMRPADRPRFVRGFCEALVAAPRSLWHDALVVIEECHLVAPQGGREAESTNAVIDLATRGRKRGFALVAVTQRISDLHKSVVAQCGNRLIGLTTLDADVKRAAYELGFEGRDQARQLAELKRGHFFGFGPAISSRVISLTIGTVQTTHAQRRGSRAAPPPPAPEKVRAILGKLADLPREAEEEARTIDSLGRRVRDLERELRTARAGAPDPAAIERAREEGRAAGAATARAAFRFLIDQAQHVVAASKTTHERVEALARAMTGVELPQVPHVAAAAAAVQRRMSAPPAQQRVPEPRPASAPRVVSSGNGHLTGPEQRILDAIAWFEQIGVTEPEQTAVAFLAGYTYGGGAFNNPRGALRTKGLVEYRAGERIALTDDGRSHARVPDAPLTSDELHRRVLDRLPGPEQRLLRPLLDAYPEALSNEELAERAGYTAGAGAFNNPRGRLRSLGLVEYPQPGRVAARSVLFVEGR